MMDLMSMATSKSAATARPFISAKNTHKHTHKENWIEADVQWPTVPTYYTTEHSQASLQPDNNLITHNGEVDQDFRSIPSSSIRPLIFACFSFSFQKRMESRAATISQNRIKPQLFWEFAA